MSDETGTETGDDTGAEAAGMTAGESTRTPAERPARPSTPTSRARRIGGRPMPFPQADAPTTSATSASATSASATSASDAADTSAARAAETRPAAKSTWRKPAGKDSATATTAPPAGPAAARGTAGRRTAAVDLAGLQRRLDQLRWVPAVVAALAVVAMLVIGAWQAHGLWWGKRLGDTRGQQQQQVLAAAKTCTAAVLSYDYRTLDKSQQAAEGCITPAFKTQYEQTFAVVKQLAPQKKAIITFQVADGGVQSVSKDGSQWVVLLYGQSSYADSTTKGNPRLDVSSPIVTLTKVDGRYLVSNLNTS